MFPGLKLGYVGGRVRMPGLLSEDGLFRNADDGDISQNIPQVAVIN